MRTVGAEEQDAVVESKARNQLVPRTAVEFLKGEQQKGVDWC